MGRDGPRLAGAHQLAADKAEIPDVSFDCRRMPKMVHVGRLHAWHVQHVFNPSKSSIRRTGERVENRRPGVGPSAQKEDDRS
jgi:hypothetical protein